MGLFSKLKIKRRSRDVKIENVKIQKSDDTGLESDDSVVGTRTSVSSSTISSLSPLDASFKKRLNKLKSLKSSDVTMEHLPDLIMDLESSLNSKNGKTPRSLKLLFALSENSQESNNNNNRVDMVQGAGGKLIPVLLRFLNQCSSKSSDQYLSLLILNNISIPSENKRLIALDHGAARTLSQLLCDDPSCHLIGIILVNLTFTDSELRKKLISVESGSGLIESLAYALRVASLTPEEYELRQQFFESDLGGDLTPKQRLEMLMAEDERIRNQSTISNYKSGRNTAGDKMIDLNNQKFPETSRWCLAALKNLSKPCDDSSTAEILVRSKVLSVILQYVTVSVDALPEASKRSAGHLEEIQNAPFTWDFNSMQDAALYVVLNLCACNFSRSFVREADAISILSMITEYEKLLSNKRAKLTSDQEKQQEFQCLKARMALAYLVGSYGNFGQDQMSSTTSTVYANPSDSVLVMTESEAEILVELLAHSLHNRGKEGAGGYSGSTFRAKDVLFAIRCLLVHSMNQACMLKVAGRFLNSLLIKSLALHTTRLESILDADAAEYACFSLYLLSNYGFNQPFLPSWLSDKDENEVLCAKVLTSYLHMANSITVAGRHAAEQLLLRLKFIMFEGEVEDLVPEGSCLNVSDLVFEDDIMAKIRSVQLGKRVHGAKPNDDIFDRPILRRRKPKTGNMSGPWDNVSSVSVFSSALHAVQQLSFGSRRVRHSGSIDDILIANNIANSANGERTEAYNFMWSWKDKAGLIQLNMTRQRSMETEKVSHPTFCTASSMEHGTLGGHLLSRFACGLACGKDTTTE